MTALQVNVHDGERTSTEVEPAPTGAPEARRGPPRGRSAFRGDIEGLRAVAVVLVILTHTLLIPSGGFLGVDVFFVISGFLITGLLLREYRRTGTLSFSGFYLRRARRILPAAVLVILATVATAYVLFSTPRAGSVAVDGVWSLFFAANWHLVIDGTDYFAATAAVESPLQHYWSLAVEEQFYLLWPWLLLLLLALPAIRRRRGSRGGTKASRILTPMIGAIVFVSFAWSAASAVLAPTFAYFDTFGRVWQLGAGALIAVTASRWQHIHTGWRPVIAWSGLALVIGSALVVAPSSQLPAPASVLAVIGVCAFLAAGTSGDQRFLFPLTNPVTRYIGRISFSLYLWHWPVIVYLHALFGAENPFVPWLAIALTLLLSVLSFHFVEDPFRRLARAPRQQRRAPHQHSSPTAANAHKVALGAVTMAAVATVALVSAAFIRVSPSQEGISSAYLAPSGGSTVASAGAATLDLAIDGTGALDTRTAELQAALRDAEWPALSPDLASFGESGRDVISSEWRSDGCLGDDLALEDDPIANAEHCRYGNPDADAAHTAVVLGDSVAISYAPTVRAALGEDWQLRVYALAACPFSEANVTRPGGGSYEECEAFREWAVDDLESLQPAFVFVSEATDNARLASGATGDDAFAEWSDGTRTSLEGLVDLTGSVFVLTRPPTGVSLYECQTPLSTPADCVADADEGFERRATTQRGIIDELGGNLHLVNTLSWFCTQGSCPAYIAGVPTYADGIHLTEAAGVAAAPLLAEAITASTDPGE